MEDQLIDQVARHVAALKDKDAPPGDRHFAQRALRESSLEIADKLLEVRDAANHFREIADQLHEKETGDSHTAAGAFETAAFYIELVLSDKHPDEVEPDKHTA